MFKRRFKNEFDFSESPFILEDEKKSKDFDRSIFVVYDKFEMMYYLKFGASGSNILVCLFDKQLHRSLLFLKEVSSVILLDDSRTRTEIVKELKEHLKIKPDCKSQIEEKTHSRTPIHHTQFYNFYKALFFLM